MKNALLLVLLATTGLVLAESSKADQKTKPAATTVIRLEAGSPGRIFEGIGAVSAGANTRNLPDYPEKERSEVLDYLFKPKFGASLQHLKVEIGGGDNSTCGSEPSHVITREELANPKPRGYEFWFMAEARKRNPAIQLDCLPWCYPGWITDRFSQDSADWFVAFLEVARKQYGLEMDWVAAAQNECGTDLKWVAHVLRPTMDRKGFGKVKIQGPDDAKRPLWAIFEEFPKDPAYDRVLQAVGYHYPSSWLPEIENDKYAAPESVKATGKPLWASEEFSMSGQTWDKALLWAQLINKNYIRDRITKTEAWCPVDSLTPGIMWEGTGLMEANEPWSGHYEVWPAIWTTAHTTQFAEPGWRYLDTGCGKFDPKSWKGTYVALHNPKTSDWSMIFCTDKPETVSVRIGDGLKSGPVHVWKSTADAQFIRQPDAQLKEGQLELTLDKNALYSLTTTEGQRKGGGPTPPDSKPFPFPYHEDFEACAPGKTPLRFSDQKGTFETVARPGGGICLQQIVPKQGILWFPKFRTPFTVWGDKNWTDYKVTVDVLIRGGSVELGGRWLRTGITDFRLAELHDTRVTLRQDGTWELLTPETIEFEDKGKKKTKVESRLQASGALAGFDPKIWHTLSITFSGATATASIDGKEVGACPAGGASNGLPFLASSYDPNCFDNLSVTPVTSAISPGRAAAPEAKGAAAPATSLREAFGGHFALGAAIPSAQLSEAEKRLLFAQFNTVTPENCMKPEATQPKEGEFRFTEADGLVEMALGQGMTVNGHTLLWPNHTPKWFFVDGDKPVSRERLLERLRTHVTTMVKHFAGRVKTWDVANEAVADGDRYLTKSPWLDIAGPDYIAEAYLAARKADPSAELYYNDFDIELPAKREKALRLMAELRDRGIRLDGIGIQGHWQLDQIPFKDIEDSILAFHAAGLPVMITELDLDVVPRRTTGANVAASEKSQKDPFTAGLPADIAQRQAEQYAQLFKLFWKHRDKIKRVTFWGLHDGISWLNTWPSRRTDHPLLWDRHLNPKPAYFQVLGAKD